jgi:hypothetical protein
LLDYADSKLAVRDDLIASHGSAWKFIAEPSSCFESSTRLAIAREARIAGPCDFCQRRKESLSPYGLDGQHSGLGELSPAVEEVVHRLVTDPGRITRAWVEQLIDEGLGDQAYVEVISLVSVLMVVDTFTRALGLPLSPLPDVVPGDATGRRPQSAIDEGFFVPTIPVGGLQDDYADLYDTRAFIPSVQRALSLVPEATRIANTLMRAHYLPYERVPVYTDLDHDRSLSKMQMELLATRVSNHNDCFY